MKNFIKLTVLTLLIIGISACGRTGELKKVKSSSLVPITPIATHIA